MIYSFCPAEYVSNSKTKEFKFYWILPILTSIRPTRSLEIDIRAYLQNLSRNLMHRRDRIPVPAMLELWYL
ncbi:MAG: hypothetical protein U9Q89_03990 [Thermodesulfobacteriota bacterium]|nr:hypothetical protein [Thermodesulfobacteriota bacterium]